MITTIVLIKAQPRSIPATATNMGGGAVCLTSVPDTTGPGPYSPAVVSPTAPGGGTCYENRIGSPW